MADEVKPLNTQPTLVGEKSGLTSRASTSSGPSNGILPLHQGDLEQGRAGNGTATAKATAAETTPHVDENGSPTGVARSKTRALFTVRPEGQSGRSGFHPFHFLAITFRSASWVSRIVNVLWPLVPAAIALKYTRNSHHNDLAIFILSYLAMIPCANLIGFAGGELAKKVPHVLGVLLETTLGSIVEIVLFMVLISREPTDKVDYIQVIQAAILGSILATMLLCLGLCFIAGGIKRDEQSFSEAVSEAGSGLLLTAGVGLAIPTIFKSSLKGSFADADLLDQKTIDISRSMAILLIVAYLVFVYFQARTHHGIYDAIFEQDTQRDDDRYKEERQSKLTFVECVIALVISITLVTIIAISLVEQIPYLVHERHVSDAFVGLILVPLVEKAAEHLTAVDEAYDNQMNFALSHVLGATLQTALFNGPLVVLVGWGLGRRMSLSFEVFDLAMLILSILTVGNFLRDQKSNYLEGFLCVTVYVGIAVAAAYFPSPHDRIPGTTATTSGIDVGGGGGHH
ncbi:hypothetical protein V8F06_013538 [Rhypophila decipiens]